MLDNIDMAILRELQSDCKKTTHQLAKVLNIPRTTIHNRIKKLEDKKIIKKYKAVVDSAKIGKRVTAIIHIVVSREQSAKEIIDRLAKSNMVLEAYIVAGQFDIIVKVVVKDTQELSSLMYSADSGLRSWKGVERSESMIVLETAKEEGIIEPEP
jgi:Lrp/AsnC family leucine-responsive transcriptional regulator